MKETRGLLWDHQLHTQLLMDLIVVVVCIALQQTGGFSHTTCFSVCFIFVGRGYSPASVQEGQARPSDQRDHVLQSWPTVSGAGSGRLDILGLDMGQMAQIEVAAQVEVEAPCSGVLKRSLILPSASTQPLD